MMIRIIASSYDGHHIGLRIRRNLRGHPETWVLNCNLELLRKGKGLQPDLKGSKNSSWLFSWTYQRKDASDFIYNLRTVKPNQTSSLLVSPAYLLLLTDTEFLWIFLHPCPCSNCFVLIASWTLHSICPLGPNLNASILHEVFLEISQVHLNTLSSLLLRHGMCYLGNSGDYLPGTMIICTTVWFPHLTSLRTSL